MAQYHTARAHYGEALRVILEEDIPDHEPPSTTHQPDASAAVPEAFEGTPVPFASSSAPEPDGEAEADAVERVRQRLRAEVVTWQLPVSPEEIEHVITHHAYARTRQILWGARRLQKEAQLSHTAAD